MKLINPVLHERLRTLISSMGYELLGYELLPLQGQMVFRIYIDSKNGITLDDCSLVSHQVSAMMDVEDPVSGRYCLEVSSPGIDRPLFKVEHYRKYVGERVRVRLTASINQRKQYKGILSRVEGEDIYLLLDGAVQALKLPFSAIEKGNLIGDINFHKTGSRSQKVKDKRKKVKH